MAASELHFLLVPLVAQGHIIPMVDLALLLAAWGPRVTVVTTPVNVARNRATIDGARRAGLAVELVELPFPGPQVGLPEGLENLDQLLDDADAALPVRLFPPRRAQPVHSTHGVYDRVGDNETEPFEVPDFPMGAVGNTAMFRGFFHHPGVEKEQRDILDAEATADGLLINTFRGVEGIFVDAYAAVLRKRTWVLGSTCTSGILDKDADAMADRGNHADVDVGHVVSWLDARPPACAGKGLVVRGWAPQVTILSHPAVGGFLTYCGWNATLKAISHGVPTLTWPCFTDQFCSERLLVDVLRVGIRSGVKVPAKNVPKVADGVQVPSGDVEKAIAELIDGGSERTVRRSRAKEVAREARAAMEEGGSSYSDLTDMIRYALELSRKRSHERDTSSMTLPLTAAELRSNDGEKIEAGAPLSLQS
ncbi:UDP-glycosyltransferase 73C1 [Triticum urartu]|uniref:UDP-glycosyltransferase 73C1 n=1 Tax=Triticum urartu TaxID=4572 RepID=M8ADL4_TRIUA|nr:UDP-glycosyltransferase 73C1 [Triticum urartu]